MLCYRPLSVYNLVYDANRCMTLGLSFSLTLSLTMGAPRRQSTPASDWSVYAESLYGAFYGAL